jgi:hypothetical protein
MSEAIVKIIPTFISNEKSIKETMKVTGVFSIIIAALVIALYISILNQGYLSYKILKADEEENKLSSSEKKVRRLNYRQSLVLASILILYIIVLVIIVRLISKLKN